MHITIEYFDGKYPSFNVSLHSKEGSDAFLTIRSCRIMDGKDGQFVAYPAKKMESGKYWNHVSDSKGFNATVLGLAKASAPTKPTPPPRQATPPAYDEFEDSAPF